MASQPKAQFMGVPPLIWSQRSPGGDEGLLAAVPGRPISLESVVPLTLPKAGRLGLLGQPWRERPQEV